MTKKKRLKRKPPFTVEDVLQDLYKRIPEFECEEGCTECCGVVPWAGIEWEKIEDKRKHETITCPYAVKGKGCEVYQNRPLVCRLFGTTEEPHTKCPRMKGPENSLGSEERDKILLTYKKIIAITGLFINSADCTDKDTAMSSIVCLLDKVIGNVAVPIINKAKEESK